MIFPSLSFMGVISSLLELCSWQELFSLCLKWDGEDVGNSGTFNWRITACQTSPEVAKREDPRVSVVTIKAKPLQQKLLIKLCNNNSTTSFALP